ncbi:hypothetical protein QMM44_01010 [Leptospira santarosai]|uniref:hypothetical protein n=1 Tax=Leptospira santarosai TaxID=28183 RepID=UPI0024AFAB5E|nr:hypothetical protein [Leptospira santarosai]MDI7202030.1 hypothetical protein [Leptospira santarosai]
MEVIHSILTTNGFQSTSDPNKFYGPGMMIAEIGDQVTLTHAGKRVMVTDNLAHISHFISGWCLREKSTVSTSFDRGPGVLSRAQARAQEKSFEERLREFQSKHESRN